MVETPPGCVATACGPKGGAGTWEDLCFPSSVESTFRVYKIGGLMGPRCKQNPTCWRKEWHEQQGEEEATSIQPERVKGNWSDFEWPANR
ncbi:MAG: hypothetical protein AB1847_23610 [bacterium]